MHNATKLFLIVSATTTALTCAAIIHAYGLAQNSNTQTEKTDLPDIQVTIPDALVKPSDQHIENIDVKENSISENSETVNDYTVYQYTDENNYADTETDDAEYTENYSESDDIGESDGYEYVENDESNSDTVDYDCEDNTEYIYDTESDEWSFDVDYGEYVEPDDFRYNGTFDYGSYSFTYYSENALPGEGLDIPGRYTDENGYVCDENGYICCASDYLPDGTVIETPLGKYACVYDCGCGSDSVIDIYTNW